MMKVKEEIKRVVYYHPDGMCSEQYKDSSGQLTPNGRILCYSYRHRYRETKEECQAWYDKLPYPEYDWRKAEERKRKRQAIPTIPY
jgi:hypothetical protein